MTRKLRFEFDPRTVVAYSGDMSPPLDWDDRSDSEKRGYMEAVRYTLSVKIMSGWFTITEVGE